MACIMGWMGRTSVANRIHDQAGWWLYAVVCMLVMDDLWMVCGYCGGSTALPYCVKSLMGCPMIPWCHETDTRFRFQHVMVKQYKRVC
jgi:hypothetical protein